MVLGVPAARGKLIEYMISDEDEEFKFAAPVTPEGPVEVGVRGRGKGDSDARGRTRGRNPSAAAQAQGTGASAQY